MVWARRTDTAYDEQVWLLDDDTTLDFESAAVALRVPPLPPVPGRAGQGEA